MEELKKHFEHACVLHQSNQLKEAAQAYQQLLVEHTTFYPAQYNLALVYLAQDNTEQALNYLHQTLSHHASHKACLQNLASLYLKSNEHELAKTYFDRAFALKEPHDSDLLFNWAQWLIQTQQPTQAYNVLQQALAQDPTLWEACYNCGTIKQAFADYEQACNHFHAALLLNKNYFPAHYNLMLCYKAQGNTIKAFEHAKKSKALAPDDKAVDFIYCALTPETQPKAMPKEYIELLFNQYAHYYEQHLTQLNYNLPQLASEWFKSMNLPKDMPLGLDLGCGTGLGAQALRAYAQEWHGVDIASEMITQAREKKCYAELYHEDISHFLKQNTQPYDLILSLEVLNYYGDIKPLLERIAKQLAPNGYWLLSCEITKHDTSVLNQQLRFEHNLQQVIALLNTHQLRIIKQAPVPLRQQKQTPLIGQLLLITR